MKNHYLPSINAFAIGIPIALLGVTLLAITFIKSSIIGDFDKNKSIYKQELTQNLQLEQLQSKSQDKQKNLKLWEETLSGNSFTKISKQLKTSIEQHNKSKQLVLIEQSRSTTARQSSAGKSTGCSVNLQGTFTDFQNSLTDLETNLPQLMVNSLSLSPHRSSNLLNLKINYTVWEK